MPAFSQTHETTIQASPETVHALVDDFHQWVKWSPWEGLDPDLQRTYDGEGVGATYAWSGNKKAGQGRMTFTSITPAQVVVALEFLKPFRAENTVTFDLTPVDGGTRVAWTMSGERNAVMSAMGRLFFDKAIGKDFEKGLAALKRAAEG
ncbi:polyketide cyclase/dehydrase/lipid transport protein [Nocardioides sp. J9]|uniref:SRPBCC family protein n=1 Tax=unclassified Nocardioides TaxID=2615069 RepID=UPI00048F96EC|nr:MULTISPECIES: SRPBCC family protein [unclassified Nocardioides]TWG97346.1 polyketide cyclase/dehydrase/lipid transport protein [Nocardioides sp. J9]